MKPCEGPAAWTDPQIVQMPRMMMFRITGTQIEGAKRHYLDEFPLVFHHHNWTCVLRSSMLSNMWHFISTIRCPNGWMHCDGMNHPRNTFYPLSQARRAMGTFSIDTVGYEAIPGYIHEIEVDRIFKNGRFDWSTEFHSNTACHPPAPPANDVSISTLELTR